MTKMLGVMVYCRIIVLLNFNLDDTLFYNPGFIKTPITDMNRFKMPMIMSPQDAADTIELLLQSNKDNRNNQIRLLLQRLHSNCLMLMKLNANCVTH
jgi:hypothetical protein